MCSAIFWVQPSFTVSAQLCISPADFAPSAPVYLRAYVEDAAVSANFLCSTVHAARPILLYLFPTKALKCVYLTDTGTKLPSSVIATFANVSHRKLVCRWPKERQPQKGRISQPRRSRLALLLQPMAHQPQAVLHPAVLQLPVKAPRSEEDRQTRRCAKRIMKASSSHASDIQQRRLP